ncbi:MAG: hypothetical protein EBU84_08510 [Actinobacteria bacterium]|nr:hypothetical protein [Actinomycetota bacterium]
MPIQKAKTEHWASWMVGKTIKSIKYLTPSDIEDFMWYCSPSETMLIVFTDGTGAIVMQDPEGNGPGFIEQVELQAGVA